MLYFYIVCVLESEKYVQVQLMKLYVLSLYFINTI